MGLGHSYSARETNQYIDIAKLQIQYILYILNLQYIGSIIFCIPLFSKKTIKI